jgi:hypothetical protein
MLLKISLAGPLDGGFSTKRVDSGVGRAGYLLGPRALDEAGGEAGCGIGCWPKSYRMRPDGSGSSGSGPREARGYGFAGLPRPTPRCAGSRCAIGRFPHQHQIKTPYRQWPTSTNTQYTGHRKDRQDLHENGSRAGVFFGAPPKSSGIRKGNSG